MALSLTATRQRLAELGHDPRKPLGQNFLVDGNIVAKSLQLGAVSPGDRVVEVGPGLGTLTGALLAAGAEVWAVELDPGLGAALRERFRPCLVAGDAPTGAGRLHMVQGDAVSLPLAGLGASGQLRRCGSGDDGGSRPVDFKVVANLPYAISTPWLEAVLAGPLPGRMVLMVQRECAERWLAAPGSKLVGAISIGLQLAYVAEPWHRVPPQCFYPAPAVESVLLPLVRRPEARGLAAETRGVIRGFFTQRRKQIGGLVRARDGGGGALSAWLEGLAAEGISPTTRPEALPWAAWLALDGILAPAEE